MYVLNFKNRIFVMKNKNDKNIINIINYFFTFEELEKRKKENPEGYEKALKLTIEQLKKQTEKIKNFELYHFLNKKNLNIKGKTQKNNFDYKITKIKFLDCKFYDLINKNINKQFKNLVNNNENIKIEIQNQCTFTSPFTRYTTKKAVYYIKKIDNNKIEFYNNYEGVKSFLSLNYKNIYINNNIITLSNKDLLNYNFIITDLKITKQLKRNIKTYKTITKEIPKPEKTTAKKENKKTIKKVISININDLKKIENEIKQNKNINNIEILGAWIWCETLDTAARDYLMARGFKFSFSKLKFYYHNKPYKKRNKKCLSYEKIRALYKECEAV